MKVSRWTLLLHNQVVSLVLLFLLVVPMLFGAGEENRVDQLTAYGYLGLLVLVILAARSRDRLSLDRALAFVTAGPNLPIILFGAWSALSIFWSASAFYSWLGAVQLGVGLVLYAVVVYQFRRKEQVRALLGTLLLAAVALVLVALQRDLDRLMTERLIAGTFHDRQLFGAFLSLVLPVLLGLAAGTRNRTWKIAAQIGAILVVGALVFTQCRSAWLGALTALVLFGALSLTHVHNWRGLDRRKHELLITPLLAIVVLGIFFAFTRSGNLFERIPTSFSGLFQDASTVDRLNDWSVSLKVIGARPVHGWGAGAYSIAQAQFNPNSRSVPEIRQTGPSLWESPHNTYLQIAGELGIVGLLFYLAILGMFFYTGIRALGQMEKGLRKFVLIGCLAAVGGQAVDAVSNPAWMFPEVTTFFWLILGLGMCAAGVGQTVRVDEPIDTADAPVLGMPRFLYRGVRTAAIGCAAILIGVQLMNLNVAAAAGVPPIFRGIAPREARGQGNSDDGFSDIGGGRGHRPIYCDFITRLDLDFFNDNIPVPAAFDINAGAIHPDRLAAFQLFALTDDPRFYANVTTERKSIKVRVHGLKGRFYYSESSGIPRIFFRPDQDQAGKTGTITFYYQCRRPPEVFRTRFVLTVLRSPAPIDESAGAAGVRLDVDTPATRGGSPLETIAIQP